MSNDLQNFVSSRAEMQRALADLGPNDTAVLVVNERVADSARVGIRIVSVDSPHGVVGLLQVALTRVIFAFFGGY